MTPSHVILSPTLAANEKVQALRAAGKQVFHMGFGQAPFPVHPRLREALKKHSHRQEYLGVAGLPELCEAVLNHQAALTGLDKSKFDVIVGPGSKLILYALQMAIEGDIMLPVPSWVSYAPQAALLGQHVVAVPTQTSGNTLKLTAASLESAFRDAKKAGLHPTKLLINFPGNPTGITIDTPELDSIASFCRSQNIILISDEIYGRLSFDGNYRSATSHFPEGAVVTTGLSKHLSLGGWRLGVGIIPRTIEGLHERLVQIASETWSCVSTPVQYAAIEAYQQHDDVEHYITQCRNIHEVVNTYIANSLNQLGFNCPAPAGAFYTWPDFSSVNTTLGLIDSKALADLLLDDYGVVTLPGSAFGEPAQHLRLRLSGCDYDGQHALNLLAQHGADNLAEHLDQLAPNVTGAIHQFGKLAQRLCQ